MTCRIAVRHRATADVDVVTEDPEVVAAAAPAVANLIDAGVGELVEGSPTAAVYVDGTRVEIIETSPIEDHDAAEVEPERARLFVLAHRWGFDSAEELTIGVAETSFRVTLPVATPAALVAMKLHAFEDRQDARKQASDAWDIYRLLETHNQGGRMAGGFADAPAGLTALVGAAVQRVFVENPTRTRNRVRDYGQPQWAGILTEDVMRDLGHELAEALSVRLT